MRCLDCLKMRMVALTGQGEYMKHPGFTFYPQAGLCQGGYPFLVDLLVERQCPKFKERKRKLYKEIGY